MIAICPSIQVFELIHISVWEIILSVFVFLGKSLDFCLLADKT